jgi:hypothetical protein
MMHMAIFYEFIWFSFPNHHFTVSRTHLRPVGSRYMSSGQTARKTPFQRMLLLLRVYQLSRKRVYLVAAWQQTM